ncbi:SIS domain-containing protein [Lysinibacillus piscis]|uniref:SIS domain-containing protein n=1 Tax=Lysinibacillus piscis TaxID=2518931 RepID=A0ABQ5NJE6_9BACI|nr:SIS domain-containing protein [Lysinibacillus sp. KH24]GLC88483.1 hypothetical protein LYSBPC_16100 [Lysinibacillus sp. KH24]
MDAYFKEIQHLLRMVEEAEETYLAEVAIIIGQKLQLGGIIHLFGCGHSQLLAQDAFYRAGGLVPIHPIIIEPLTIQAGAVIASNNEKDATLLARYKEQFDFQQEDVFIVISTSGRNNAPIDAALFAKEAGVLVLSLQSLAYHQQPSYHASGKRLEDIVDIVLDTHVPVGDGILSHNHLQYGPSSTVIGATILNVLFSKVLSYMASEGEELPIFESNNVQGDSAHNERMMANYQHRIKFK